MGGFRSWLAYPKSLRFQVFSLFLICRDRTRCTAKSIRSQEDKKKNFPSLFLIRRDRARCTAKSIRSQGRQQSETKTKGSNNKLINIWEIKKNKTVTVTLYLQICRNGCFWSKRKRFSVKRKLFPNGNGAPDVMEQLPQATNAQKIQNQKPLKKFRQHRFQILIKTESGSS